MSFWDTYFPQSHQENRMQNEGDVETARKRFIEGMEHPERRNHVLFHLIEQRFSWMNDYIRPEDEHVIELGCGEGLSKFFVKSAVLQLTDVTQHPWVDKIEDAMHLDQPDGSLDVIICSHMIHHMASPYRFFRDAAKKLKPGGRIIIQDIETCLLMKLALRVMRHEGWSDSVDVFDPASICNQPDDPWSANCSIPKLLFRDEATFTRAFPMYRFEKNELNECFMFYCSGGVIAKSPHLLLADGLVPLLQGLDKVAVALFPSMFASARSVVLVRR